MRFSPKAKSRASSEFRLLVAGFTIIGLSSCNGQSTVDPVQAQLVSPPPSSSSSSGSSSGSPDNPPLAFSYTLDAAGGPTTTYTTPTFSTDTTLVVRVTGKGGTITDPNYDFSMNEYCVAFTITVLGEPVSTGPIAVNGGDYLCPNSYVDLDFSSRLTTGHGPITVEVSNPEYDFYCELWAEGYILGTKEMYCPLHTLEKVHSISGNLAVEVDGTVLPAPTD